MVETVRTVESLGTEKYNRYYESVILKGEHSIHEAISKNSLALFKRPQPKPKTKQAKAIAALKNDISLFHDCILW